MQESKQKIAIACVQPVLDALCNGKKLGRMWQHDEDLISHLQLCALEAIAEYDEDSAELATFISNKLRFATMDYVRTERRRGIVMGHDASNVEPIFEAQASESSREQLAVDFDREDNELSGRMELFGEDAIAAEFSPDELMPLDKEYLASLVVEALHKVGGEHERILSLYMGLTGLAPQTLQELAQTFGWDYPETARRKVNTALHLCRKQLGMHEEAM